LSDVNGNESPDTPLSLQFELSLVVDKSNLAEHMPAPTLFQQFVVARESDHSAMILATYPGYPCAFLEEFLADQSPVGANSSYQEYLDGLSPVRDLANGNAGVCAGGYPGVIVSDSIGGPYDKEEMDDIIPVMEMPRNRSIIVSFSKEIDASSVVLGKTFK